MGHPVVHFEILGPDGPALIAFYRELFGWDLREVPMAGYDTYAYLPQPDGGIGGGVGTVEPGDAAEGHLVTLYVEVADPGATLDQAVQAGAQVTLPVTEIAGVGAIARFRDPQGNIVGLVHSASD
ncbi:MAG TPA: VOC family protein [Streptosporangiaceae bacterium]|nr:VOC family protein [Streptosporangiaceae bacterium]